MQITKTITENYEVPLNVATGIIDSLLNADATIDGASLQKFITDFPELFNFVDGEVSFIAPLGDPIIPHVVARALFLNFPEYMDTMNTNQLDEVMASLLTTDDQLRRAITIVLQNISRITAEPVEIAIPGQVEDIPIVPNSPVGFGLPV